MITLLQTNLISEKAESNIQKKIVTVQYYRGGEEDLKPAFFVSMVLSDGTSTGLSPVKCYFSSDTG